MRDMRALDTMFFMGKPLFLTPKKLAGRFRVSPETVQR